MREGTKVHRIEMTARRRAASEIQSQILGTSPSCRYVFVCLLVPLFARSFVCSSSNTCENICCLLDFSPGSRLNFLATGPNRRFILILWIANTTTEISCGPWPWALTQLSGCASCMFAVREGMRK